MYDLDGKVAMVTGAGSGIGRGIALRLAEEGCDIAALDKDAKGTEETAAGVREKGVKVVAESADVTDLNQVDSAVKGCLSELGRIDILVNSAAILRISPLVEMTAEDWSDTFRTNVDGSFYCCRAVLPHMIENRRGRVSNMASWFGTTGKPNYAAYCASKFAVIGITQSLAMEMAPHGITVNAVCPGTIVNTGMRDYADEAERARGMPTAEERALAIPLGRAGLPDDIARMTAFLASDESAYMTGQAINVTGGLWMQ